MHVCLCARVCGDACCLGAVFGLRNSFEPYLIQALFEPRHFNWATCASYVLSPRRVVMTVVRVRTEVPWSLLPDRPFFRLLPTMLSRQASSREASTSSRLPQAPTRANARRPVRRWLPSQQRGAAAPCAAAADAPTGHQPDTSRASSAQVSSPTALWIHTINTHVCCLTASAMRLSCTNCRPLSLCSNSRRCFTALPSSVNHSWPSAAGQERRPGPTVHTEIGPTFICSPHALQPSDHANTPAY